jgi:hypothetical protein
MAFSHGSLATLEIDPAGATSYTDISEYLNEAGVEVDIDTAETTTLGNTAKTYIPGLEDGTFELSGLFDPAADALFDSCKRVIVTFRYRPAGAGAGLPQFTGQAVLSSYGIETTVEDAATIEAEFQVTGAITRTVQS